MSRTYKATGINLKSMPLGESDRLLTILTREFGLVRAVAMGARKHNSRLGGRSGLFVVNELLIAKGRSLDKVTQAETLESYPGLAHDLKKLTASQYLAELCLCQALSDQPQDELFCLLNDHLGRLEHASAEQVLAHLTHAVFQFLVLAGVAPQVHLCCLTQHAIVPDLHDPAWQIGFSIPAGGTVTLAALTQLQAPSPRQANLDRPQTIVPRQDSHNRVAEPRSRYQTAPAVALNTRISASQLTILQQLAQANLPQPVGSTSPTRTLIAPERVWTTVERLLRQYAEYHFDRPIRSATLIDACFLPQAITPQPSES